MKNTYFFLWTSLSLVFCSFLATSIRAFEEVVFTSPVRIRRLFNVENRIIDAIDGYIKAEESRIAAIQNFTETWTSRHNARMENKLNFLSNPVNSFQFIKTMTHDWESIIKSANDVSSRETFHKIKDELRPMLPTAEDMRGIMDVLINMRNVYQYDVRELAVGVFGKFATNVTVSFEECALLSERSLKILDYNNAIDWAQAALIRFVEDRPMNVEDELLKLFKISAEANVMKGDYATAMNCVSSYLQFEPTDKKMQKLKTRIEQKLQLPTSNEEIRSQEEIEEKMKKLCNQDWRENNNSKLRCKYNFENSPFLRLAPLKEELLSKNPRIVLFHDVLYNSEIEFLINHAVSRKYKKLTQQQLNEVNNEFDDSEEVKRLRRRTRDMTTFHTNIIQRFEISNQGYGEIKHEISDTLSSDSIERQTFGQRIATVSFLLSDVSLGGATIFPHIDLTIPPIRGSALLWFNTKATGNEDIRVRHINCPVVLGYKWVLVSWINEKKVFFQQQDH